MSNVIAKKIHKLCIAGWVMSVDMNLYNILKEECLELVFIYDKTGKCITCSNKARESLGYLPEEEVGKFEISFPNIFWKKLPFMNILRLTCTGKMKLVFLQTLRL